MLIPIRALTYQVISGAAEGSQELQTERSAGDTAVSSGPIWNLYSRIFEELPQAREISGATAGVQALQTTQAEGFAEDEAEILALLIAIGLSAEPLKGTTTWHLPINESSGSPKPNLFRRSA
jgi:hypothetical protein